MSKPDQEFWTCVCCNRTQLRFNAAYPHGLSRGQAEYVGWVFLADGVSCVCPICMGEARRTADQWQD